MATATTYSPSQDWNGSQLDASSSASDRYGVPLDIVRGVTGYKYGSGATTADFDYVAAQLASWYTTYYKQSGDALEAWQKAAAQEMPGATSIEVAIATATQSVAQTGEGTALAFTGLADTFGAISTDLEDATGAAATDASSLSGDNASADTTGTGSPSSTSSSGASTAEAATAGGAAGYASKALSNLASLAKAGGIAALLVDPSFLWRMIKIVGGLALAYIGVKQLANVGGAK